MHLHPLPLVFAQVLPLMPAVISGLSPIALFVVMLPKAHMTSHSRMFGSRWVITPSCYLGHKDLFCTLFCVVLLPLINIFCFCYVQTFLSFILPIFAWNVPLVSLMFLKRSLVFPILLFSSISLHCLLKKAFFSLLLFLGTLHSVGYIFLFLLWLLPFFFPWLFVRHPQITTFPSCISYSLGWFWSLPPVLCYKSLSIVLRILCLMYLIPWI